jgi:DNA-binding NtrC family response regulator
MASRGRILIADDEKAFLKYSADLFKKEGFVCDCAINGAEAIDLLRAHQYDVVISDIRMPGNSDLKLAQEVSRLQDGVPVVLVTGYPSMDTAVRAVELPVVAYIEKPVEFKQLLSRVESAIMRMRKHMETMGAHECGVGRCARINELVEEIDEAVNRLESTKRSFKSKEVSRVRTKLDAASRRNKQQKN